MYSSPNLLVEKLIANAATFHSVVDFDHKKDKIIQLDFTKENEELSTLDLVNTNTFSEYVADKLKKTKAKFGIGGYEENRTLYKRSRHFDSPVSQNSSSQFIEKELLHEGRTLHLGMDIWGEEGTKVYAPLGGMVHSYAFNNNFGDYGATLILLHQIETVTFYTLYGHLSLEDIARVSEFQYIIRGFEIGHFGKPEENGHWPPHLHFQIIKDMRTYKGDYPGVCKLNEAEKYLANCPDPNLILQMMDFTT
jgi:murein DD-endopeptidase MepM/ murein hydrolase activator NlpD